MMPRSLLSCLAALPLLAAGSLRAADPPPVRQQPVTLAEARRLTRLMDDIYVTGVLTTHRMYAREPGTAAAVAWGKQVIRQVNRKGWPEARIFGAPERILNPDNLPEAAFEKAALAAFRNGRRAFEETAPGEYRYATAILASEASCLSCHVRNREGDLLGGVGYRQALRR